MVVLKKLYKYNIYVIFVLYSTLHTIYIYEIRKYQILRRVNDEQAIITMH